MKKLAWLGLGSMAALTLAVWASPYVAAYQIRDRAAAKDEAALAELVDFPALQRSVDTQFKAYLREEARKAPDDPFSDVALVFASFAVDALVENVASPRAFAYLASLELSQFQLQYRDLNSFEIITPNLDGEPVTFELNRDGWFSWRLRDVALPLSS